MTAALLERDEAAQASPQPGPGRVSEGTVSTDGIHLTRVHASAVGDIKRAVASVAAEQLRSLVERIENLEREKAGIASDIKDLFTEARGNGFDVKTLRKVIALRKQDAAERDEAEHLLDTYCAALGIQTSLNFDGEGE